MVFSAGALAGCGTATTTTTTAEETTSSTLVTATSETSVTSLPKLPKLTLVVPPGPMAIPAAYLAAGDKLSAVAESTEVIVWENPEQLRAIVASSQGDFVTFPANNAAIFYNRGLKVQLLDVSVWNITYMLSYNPDVKSLADMKAVAEREGLSVAVSFQGSVPDLMFQYMCLQQGIDPMETFDVRYVADPTQAAQTMLSGAVDAAVIGEMLATAVLAQAKEKGEPGYRAFGFEEEWQRSTDATERTPIAGTVATGAVMGRPDVIDEFIRQCRAAVEWMVANPEEAGRLVEQELPQLGLKGAVVSSSMQNITWEHVEAKDARFAIEAFFSVLAELSPDVIGGKLPDDGFYYPGLPE